MKIGFYSPYLDSLSGGERYVLTLASHWSKKHRVDLFWDNNKVLDQAQKRLNLNLSNIKIVHNVFRKRFLPEKYIKSLYYDLFFFLTDGSLPLSFAKHNILHFQVPFSNFKPNTWKLNRFDAIVVNSRFTRMNLPRQIKKRSIIIYPPVDTDQFTQSTKEPLIISVGRFSSEQKAKKQEILIESFINLIKNPDFRKFKLMLLGGLLESDTGYFNELKKKVLNYPIDLVPNAGFSKIKSAYQKAIIYWHAAGYGEVKPENMEHFGISTVEAMASGAIPIVYNGGGLPEIVTDNLNGYLWKTPDELMEKTGLLLKSGKTIDQFKKNAVTASRKFRSSVFTESFDSLLYKIINEK